MALDAKLVVVGGDVKTEEIKLRLPSTVGRGRGTTIVLPHPLVSRQHCELFEQDGQLMVRDLGSLNGTFVNNQKVEESPISPGELLTIGTVTFRAVYETGSAGGAKPQAAAGKAAKPSKETLRVAPAKGKAAAKAPRDSEIVDFGTPLFSPEDEGGPKTEPVPASKSLESTLPDKPKPKQAKAPAAKAPAPAPKQPAAKPVEKRASDEATIDFKHRAKDEDDDEPVASSSDEDLDDFLKSLES